MTRPNCALCDATGGELVYQDRNYRVVLVDEPGYPGFCRLIWNRHVAEMTDLTRAERAELMDALWRTEQAMREALAPDKINLASFGNMVPHLHWHVIPRYRDDPHFPHPVWGEKQREAAAAAIGQRLALLPKLRAALAAALQQPE